MAELTVWSDSPFLLPVQNPGLFFRRSSFEERWKKLPKDGKLYGASWYATKDSLAIGANCHVVVEVDEDRKLRLTECWHRLCPIDEAVGMMRLIHDGHLRMQETRKSLNSRRAPNGVLSWFTDMEQLDRAVGVVVTELQRQGHQQWAKDGRIHAQRPQDPPVRALQAPFDLRAGARRLQAMLSDGQLVLPSSSAGWVGALGSELAMWPAVGTEARVGALAVLVAGLQGMAGPTKARRTDRHSGAGWAA